MPAKRMTTVSFMNNKGGTGKTTTVVNTAKVLADKGYSVLVVDMDQQGNSGVDVFNIDTEDDYTTLEVLKGEVDIKDVVKRSYTLPEGGEPGKDRGVDVLASDAAMSELALTGAAIPGVQFRLKAALEHVQDDYDFCIVDCPPSTGYETTMALTASDYVVIPTEADYFSSKGFIRMHGVIQDVRKWYNPNIEVLGILITQYDSRTRFSKEITANLEKYSEKFSTFVYDVKIRTTVRVKEGHNEGLTVVEYEPKSTTAQDYVQFTEELLVKLSEQE